MSEARKNEILEDFRRPNPGKSSRSRDLKERLHNIRSKETFLTDTQTSDYTRSSGEIKSPTVEHLKELIRKLQRENAELRQKVIDLKTSQYFEVNEQKLKNMIMQNEHLQEELESTKKQLEQSLVERDFLQRFNKNLKAQCESLTKEILVLKATSSTGESKKIEKNIYTTRDEGQHYKNRNQSRESVLSSKKKQFLNLRKEKQEKQKQSSSILKSCLSTSRLQQDYYGGKTSRQRPFRHH